MTDVGLENLIVAIVKQAAKDLKSRRQQFREDAYLFFHSEWFEYLTGMDGSALYDKIVEMQKEEM